MAFLERAAETIRVRIPRAETREGSSGKQARVERVGRNGPCPCNSGKKYKHCCLEQDEANESRRRLSEMLEERFDLTGRLKRARRPKDPTDTIRHLVEVMQREVATRKPGRRAIRRRKVQPATIYNTSRHCWIPTSCIP